VSQTGAAPPRLGSIFNSDPALTRRAKLIQPLRGWLHHFSSGLLHREIF
jgi:hypothetical protein